MGDTGRMTTPMAQDLAALQEHELRDLALRYDVPGPRYTSYPALPDWNGSFDADSWERHLTQLAAPDAAVALYVHLPFCVARCLYCGCNATVTTRDEVVDRYLARLAREIAWASRAIGARPAISAMHWGGGTPNFPGLPQLERLVLDLDTAFDLHDGTERSIEADPRLVTREQLRGLRALGFTRISFGVQDLDADVQQAIGRVQPESLVRDVVAMARDEGFTGINVDLIYGLPRQTRDSFARTVDSAIGFGADRLACFGYAHVPWMRAHQRRIDERTLPGGPERMLLFHDAVQRLVQAGYVWLGFDHFARPNDPLAVAEHEGTLHRNFMGYTTRDGEHLLVLGVSAISEVAGRFVQSESALGAWQRGIDTNQVPMARRHVQSADDAWRARAIMHLLCQAELPDRLWLDDPEALATAYAPFVEDGLLRRESDGWRVTTRGRFVLRNLAFPLDPHRRATSSAPQFSRAV
ncbi:MAG: oxygen-independent coproporphyrinogen III oxidase [Gemmatimonadaceae bacterium]|nr:oxygen-independent coproporphyrinogen III oxidase [Gemmatimonadaceae bacterium]